MAGFLAEVKDKYNSLLSTNGIITVEMLKAVLKDKDTTCAAKAAIPCGLAVRKQHEMLFAASKFEKTEYRKSDR